MLSTMKTLNELYVQRVNESAKDKAFVTNWAESLKGTKLNKEQIVKMLENIDDIKRIKILSDHLYEIDSKHYIAYQPADDMFISASNKSKVIQTIADYLVKYVV